MIRKPMEFHSLQDVTMPEHRFDTSQHLYLMYGIVLLCRVELGRIEDGDICRLLVFALTDNTGNACATAIGNDIDGRGAGVIIQRFLVMIPANHCEAFDILKCTLVSVSPTERY